MDPGAAGVLLVRRFEDINPLKVPSGPGWPLCQLPQYSHRQDEPIWLALCFVRDLRGRILWL